MKKFLLVIATVMIIALAALPSVAAEPPIRVIMDGTELSFDAQPRIVNDRTLVPLRGIFEAMGATVLWNGDTQTVTALRLDTVVKLTVNNNRAKVNKADKTLDVPAQIFQDRTFVPLRFISESMGANVEWVDSTRTVNISTDKAHWSDPGMNLNFNLLFLSEWENIETGEHIFFDPEDFTDINDSWPTGDGRLYYSYSETNTYERNIIHMYLGGAHLKDHYFEFDPDTQILSEYMFTDILSNWRLAGGADLLTG